MVKVFISQPMRGKTSEQIRAEHNEWQIDWVSYLTRRLK